MWFDKLTMSGGARGNQDFQKALISSAAHAYPTARAYTSLAASGRGYSFQVTQSSRDPKICPSRVAQNICEGRRVLIATAIIVLWGVRSWSTRSQVSPKLWLRNKAPTSLRAAPPTP